jgi:hypothetical protein
VRFINLKVGQVGRSLSGNSLTSLLGKQWGTQPRLSRISTGIGIAAEDAALDPAKKEQ